MLSDPEHRRDRINDLFRIADRCELAQPGAVGKVRQHLLGDLQRETRLAHPTNPGERHDARVTERVDRAGDLSLAVRRRS